MELKFNDAKSIRPIHLERCLCYDKFLKGYRCYVYDDISKYWCTQATTEHDPDGENHIADYADYQVIEWASLQQKQPEIYLNENTMEKDLALTWQDIKTISRIIDKLVDEDIKGEIPDSWRDKEYFGEVLQRFNKVKENK